MTAPVVSARCERADRSADRRTIRRVLDSPMTIDQTRDWAAAGLGLAVVIAIVLVLAGRTGGTGYVGLEAVWILVTSAPRVALWLAAAAGVGWPLRCWFAPGHRDGPALQIALGVAGMLLLDALLGRLDVLQFGGSIGAWAALVPGAVLLAIQIVRICRTSEAFEPPPPHWAIWLAALSLAVLVIAACSAPGWLWSSEFGGYDALSYHLQLPKEWMLRGRIVGLDHNVYSFLPSYVEGAYAHLAVLRGDAIAAAYDCQLLHATITVLTAWIVSCIASRFAGRIGAAVAAIVVLGTPWTIVVGSLAYNEMFTALMLAGGLLIALDDRPIRPAWRTGVIIGILAGAACGAKLTAAGFVAIPLGVTMMLSAGSVRRALIAASSSIAAALVVLLPYLVGNAVQTGNPVFPFAGELLGLGHWTSEQARIFRGAHQYGGGVAARLVEGWNQLMRYGIGQSPYVDEPWQPQWSVLPWLTLFAAMLGLSVERRRRMTALMLIVIVIQLAFWLSLTHIKSRFMLPMVVPAALVLAIGVETIAQSLHGRSSRCAAGVTASIAAVVYCFIPVAIYLREPGGREPERQPAWGVGKIDLFTGDAFERQRVAGELMLEALAVAPRGFWINHGLGPDAKVLCVGDATPFYYRGDRYDYATVWDRGPMSQAIRDAPNDPAAWFDALREDGYTHLLIDTIMLPRWHAAGWSDPILTLDRIVPAADRHARRLPVATLNTLIYDLTEPAALPQTTKSQVPEPGRTTSISRRSICLSTRSMISSSFSGRSSAGACSRTLRSTSSASE
jgi:hypothetical protein